MKNLEIIQNENGKQAVQCSQLYKALGLDKTNYSRWVEKNILNNPFAIDGEDFIFLSTLKGRLRNKRRSLSRHYDEINNLVTPLTRHNDEIRTRNRQKVQDFVLTLDFAKRLAMMCRTEQGEKVRRYFLECEKIAINQDNSAIEALKQRISFYERIEQIKQIRVQLNKEIKQLRQFIETPPQIIQPVLKQLTLNFPEYEN
ncbi:antA/AntB antirepressor family protein [Flavobacterium covae]|uniref:antA/AntB antirepressor family protein n=1 Tax=Flavobacterium covae TaxID=2906076 RepID=UPI001FB6F144|nr:antA/AntB antirepressor family protein [Flavobacterium covae]MCJ1806138.1 antA/AntB antirepressor family protein [Flavobacterium covae]